jgi:hypothetical protein
MARPGTFRKGVSGNPGGRPKAALNVQELARAHTEDAIRALVAALQNPRERVQAATALLDRGWGKPAQAIEASAQEDITVWHLIAASEFKPGPVIDGQSNGEARKRIPVDLSKPPLE